eukprot:102016-Pyramimonas_sp.AAC.2
MRASCQVVAVPQAPVAGVLYRSVLPHLCIARHRLTSLSAHGVHLYSIALHIANRCAHSASIFQTPPTNRGRSASPAFFH